MSEPTELQMLELIAEEAGKAKQLLRDEGFGVTGTNLLNTVKEAIERLHELGHEAE